MRFVVHEHQAQHHHWDFRLELAGALKSWAVPKGPSLDPSQKHLAIRVPDHPLSYAKFEGIIPEGLYGAGPVVIWDRGTYVPAGDTVIKDLKEGKLSFELRGKKLRGGFTLVRLKRGNKKEWLLIKKADDFAQRTWHIESALTPSRLRSLREKQPPCDTQ
ncbi:MAG TPA: DNA polymerase ligase N-terminal domain-containing protein [Vicinamibacteria bacterium]|jgi:bifunctional non-homologous end joining protein LigD